MDNNPDSVYSLITKLCEKFKKTYESQNTTTSYDLKAIRAKCFEILLHKTHYEIGKKIFQLNVYRVKVAFNFRRPNWNR